MSLSARVAAAWLALLAAPASAQSCTVSGTALAFGTYDPFAALPHDSTGTITVQCAVHVVELVLPYSIALSAGGGSYAARRMASGGSLLAYQIHTSALHLSVWGDGSAGTATVGSVLNLSTLLSRSATHTMHGRVAAGQGSVPPGNYGDTITVTITY